jgi:hypothetical protein
VKHLAVFGGEKWGIEEGTQWNRDFIVFRTKALFPVFALGWFAFSVVGSAFDL